MRNFGSAKKRSTLIPFSTPEVPYFTGFLMFLSVRISVPNTPLSPGEMNRVLAELIFLGGTKNQPNPQFAEDTA